jgi:molybdate transport system ATP-binding protein
VTGQLEIDVTATLPGFTLELAERIPLAGITVITGPSGGGKTTLLRVIAGLEPAVRGTIRFDGADWSGLAPHRRGIGFVFQDVRLFPHMDVAANLAYGARRRGAGREMVAAVIEALDLGPLLHRAPQTLSGGEARRVALGRALAARPRLLVMDEPLTGLDRARKERLQPYIARAVADFGVPLLYVTHGEGEITYLADRVLTIAGGRAAGWQPPAPRLTGRVRAAGEGWIELERADAVLRVEGQGRVGEIWAIPLGRDLSLSTRDPGATSGVAVLEGRILGPEPGEGAPETRPHGLETGGERLTIPASWVPAPLRGVEGGGPVWLSLARIRARPLASA